MIGLANGSLMINVVAILLLLLGLALTATGAWIASRTVILSDDQIKELAKTKWGGNEALARSFRAQSKNTKTGLLLVSVGTIFQVVGTVLPLFPNFT
jgi:putative salt-induced outer membrane protein YdiY